MLLNLFISLFPVALYLFILAGINRRERPVMIPGIWEVLGLFFALSGFLLFLGPRLLNQLYLGELNTLPLDEGGDLRYDALWQKWIIIWVWYYVALVLFLSLLIVLRGNVRSIHNVDLELFRDALLRTVDQMNLIARNQKNTLTLYLPGRYADAPDAPPIAELHLDVFPAMCHVNLRWRFGSRELRDGMLAALDENMAEAVALDNPSANWFLGIASLLFGALFMFLAMIVFGRFFPRRGF